MSDDLQTVRGRRVTMVDLMTLAIGAVVGVSALIFYIYGLEGYRSWKYRWTHDRELRNRPKIPFKVEGMVIHKYGEYPEYYWGVDALDSNGEQIENETGGHPMDAILNLVERMKDREGADGEG